MALQNGNYEFFEKMLALASVPHFGRPCRGLRTLTGFRVQWQGGKKKKEREFIIIHDTHKIF